MEGNMRKGWMHVSGFEGQERFAPRTLAECVLVDDSESKSILQAVNEGLATIPTGAEIEAKIQALMPLAARHELTIPAFNGQHSISIAGVAASDLVIADLYYDASYENAKQDYDKLTHIESGDGAVVLHAAGATNAPFKIRLVVMKCRA